MYDGYYNDFMHINDSMANVECILEGKQYFIGKFRFFLIQEAFNVYIGELTLLRCLHNPCLFNDTRTKEKNNYHGQYC